jgi:hypothetical protein
MERLQQLMRGARWRHGERAWLSLTRLRRKGSFFLWRCWKCSNTVAPVSPWKSWVSCWASSWMTTLSTAWMSCHASTERFRGSGGSGLSDENVGHAQADGTTRMVVDGIIPIQALVVGYPRILTLSRRLKRLNSRVAWWWILFSPSRKGGDWLLRLINPQLMMLGQNRVYVQHWSCKSRVSRLWFMDSIVTITVLSLKQQMLMNCTSNRLLDALQSCKIIKSRRNKSWTKCWSYQGLQRTGSRGKDCQILVDG